MQTKKINGISILTYHRASHLTKHLTWHLTKTKMKNNHKFLLFHFSSFFLLFHARKRLFSQSVLLLRSRLALAFLLYPSYLVTLQMIPHPILIWLTQWWNRWRTHLIRCFTLELEYLSPHILASHFGWWQAKELQYKYGKHTLKQF